MADAVQETTLVETVQPQQPMRVAIEPPVRQPAAPGANGSGQPQQVDNAGLQARIAEYEKREKEWETTKTRLDGYDNWYRRTVEPNWGSPQEFQEDIVKRLVPMRNQRPGVPRGPMNPPTGPGAAQRFPQRQGLAPMAQGPQMPANRQEMKDVLEGLADDEWITAAQARKLAARLQEGRFTQADINRTMGLREQQFATQLHQWLTQQFQDYQKHLYGQALPQAFALYDSTKGLRDAHKDDPEFDISKVVEVMTQRGIADPSMAYREAYGERDNQKALEKAREEGRAKAKEEYQQEQKARNVTVLSGNGGFFPTRRGEEAPKDENDAMRNAWEEVSQKYPHMVR